MDSLRTYAMENGVENLSKAEGESLKTARIVILIFVATSRSKQSWQALTAQIFESIEGWVEHEAKPLDSTQSSGSVNDEGSIYEIQASISLSTGSDNVILADCQSLRDSHIVRDFELKEDVQVIIQPFDLYLAHKIPGMAVFDMDSTLIQQEVIDELARAVGRYEQVAAITEAAMRGELDFEESLRARVAQLKGVSTEIWEKLKQNVITFTPGAREVIVALKNLGWKTAVLSGGFTPLAYWVKETLGLDYAYANQLGVDTSDSTLTGELVADAPIVHATSKRDHLVRLAAENAIPIANTIAVGDGSNDLLMMNAAGLGIAFNAKPKVQAAAPAKLNSATLLDIMHVLGFTKQEIIGALMVSVE